jgi:uncharacterized protein
MKSGVIVFVKEPVPGEVKTRLLPDLLPDEAATVYRAMVEDLLSRLDSGPARPLVLCYTPDEAADTVAAWLGSDREYLPQGSGDLGSRLTRAIRSGFERGWRGVIVAGSDVPGIDAEVLRVAEKALDEHDLVIARSPDGGYSLIGLRREAPELFAGIPWSTNAVFRLTIACAAALGMAVRCLPSLPDVDTYEDLARIHLDDPDRFVENSPRTAAALRQAMVRRGEEPPLAACGGGTLDPVA